MLTNYYSQPMPKYEYFIILQISVYNLVLIEIILLLSLLFLL